MPMGIRRWWRQWRRQILLERAALPDEIWAAALAPKPGLFAGLNGNESARLRELTTLFLAGKEFYGARGFLLTDPMRAEIAVRACLPILNLDLDQYAGWQSLVIYEESFIAPREEIDEDGIVHRGEEVLAGESWEDGPVVLSWADCAAGVSEHRASADQSPAGDPAWVGDVVIHEFAHKLDMNSGAANGMPPLPAAMSRADWATALGAAYDRLQALADAGRELPLDEYAAHDPAEFFAVCSEYFFLAPARLVGVFPEVYRQLSLYYRQDPLARHKRPGGTYLAAIWPAHRTLGR